MITISSNSDFCRFCPYYSNHHEIEREIYPGDIRTIEKGFCNYKNQETYAQQYCDIDWEFEHYIEEKLMSEEEEKWWEEALKIERPLGIPSSWDEE